MIPKRVDPSFMGEGINPETITSSEVNAYCANMRVPQLTCSRLLNKGRPPSADLRYGGKDNISPTTLIFAAIKGSPGIYILYIHPDVPKMLALRGS